MTYTLTKGDVIAIPRVAVLRGIRDAEGNDVAVLITVTGPMTERRRAECQRIAVAAACGAYPDDATQADIAAAYDRHPWVRWDDVTVWHESIVNDDDRADIRNGWGYSHDHGVGTLPARTVMATI